jgi:hypothetical protein
MSNLDWGGNKKSTFATLGASNHSEYERADRDFYATHESAIIKLYKKFWQSEEFGNEVWENACGNFHLVNGLKSVAPHIKFRTSDIVERDYPCEVLDFLDCEEQDVDMDIVTNPPYNQALEFVQHSLKVLKTGRKVAMFLKLTFLEGQKRRKFFDEYPPKKVLVFSQRIQAALNGDPKMFEKSSAACYAWFIWEVGYKSKPIIDWI